MTETKLFFTIGEVAQIIEVKPYVLRYWETEFTLLDPQKSETGQRIYRNQDIQIAKLIKQLLYVEKYTIAGAKQKLEELEKSGFDFTNIPPVLAQPAPVSPEIPGITAPTPSKSKFNMDPEKGFEFKNLILEIRKILQKYNLA